MTTEARPACDGDWALYDRLIEHERRTPLWVVAEAKKICGSCDLRDTCLVENRDEQWVQTLVGYKPPPTIRPTCGAPKGINAHYRNREEACAKCKAVEAERSRQRKSKGAVA